VRHPFDALRSFAVGSYLATSVCVSISFFVLGCAISAAAISHATRLLSRPAGVALTGFAAEFVVIFIALSCERIGLRLLPKVKDPQNTPGQTASTDS
jgi:hypothetical protein